MVLEHLHKVSVPLGMQKLHNVVYQPSSCCLSFCVTSITLGASKLMEEMGDYCMVPITFLSHVNFSTSSPIITSQSSTTRTLHPALPQLRERANYRWLPHPPTFCIHLEVSSSQRQEAGSGDKQALVPPSSSGQWESNRFLLGHSPVRRPCDCGLSDKRSGPGVWVQADLFSTDVCLPCIAINLTFDFLICPSRWMLGTSCSESRQGNWGYFCMART